MKSRVVEFIRMEPQDSLGQGRSFERLQKITPLSKYFALALFIVMPFIGGLVGYTYVPEKIIEVESAACLDTKVEVSPLSTTTAKVIGTQNINQMAFSEPTRYGAYLNYSTENGIIEGSWSVWYGPNAYGGPSIFFEPDNSNDPIKDRFLLMTSSNETSSQVKLFDLDLQNLENATEDCTLEGGRATIQISSYNSLVAEIGATDYAVVKNVVTFSPATVTNCR